MSRREPLFAGLVYNEAGEPAIATWVGDEPFYAVPDGDFMRHVEAVHVDRQALVMLKEYLLGMKDLVIDGAMEIMGHDDPFTRAAIEMSLQNIDQVLNLPLDVANIEDMRLGFWMSGLRVVVDVHGDVVRVELQGAVAEE